MQLVANQGQCDVTFLQPSWLIFSRLIFKHSSTWPVCSCAATSSAQSRGIWDKQPLLVIWDQKISIYVIPRQRMLPHQCTGAAAAGRACSPAQTPAEWHWSGPRSLERDAGHTNTRSYMEYRSRFMSIHRDQGHEPGLRIWVWGRRWPAPPAHCRLWRYSECSGRTLGCLLCKPSSAQGSDGSLEWRKEHQTLIMQQGF